MDITARDGKSRASVDASPLNSEAICSIFCRTVGCQRRRSAKLETMTLKHLRPGSAAEGQTRAKPDVVAFLARLDHDLRTPLGTMAAAIDLLRSEPPGTPSYIESIEVLQRQLGRLHSLTEVLREFSQDLGR